MQSVRRAAVAVCGIFALGCVCVRLIQQRRRRRVRRRRRRRSHISTREKELVTPRTAQGRGLGDHGLKPAKSKRMHGNNKAGAVSSATTLLPMSLSSSSCRLRSTAAPSTNHLPRAASAESASAASAASVFGIDRVARTLLELLDDKQLSHMQQVGNEFILRPTYIRRSVNSRRY